MIKVDMRGAVKELGKLAKRLEGFERQQLPFAQSKALNAVADNIRNEVVRHIDKTFEITNKSWNKFNGQFSVKRTSASKKNLEVTIFFPKVRGQRHFIERHQYSGSRYPIVGDEIFVPTNMFFKAYPVKTNKGVKLKLSKLLSDKKKNRIFEATINGNRYIMQRAKGREPGIKTRISEKTGRRLKPKSILERSAVPLFLIKSRVKQRPELEFYKIANKVEKKTYKKEFDKAMAYAMATAKK